MHATRFAVFLVCGLTGLDAAAAPPALRVTDGPERRVEVQVDERALLQSPAEGLWSIATAWSNDWPAGWHHAGPERTETVDGWTVVTGHLDLPEGRLDLRDAYRTEGDLVKCVRRFAWRGGKPLPTCTLSVRWVIPGATGIKPLLPGIICYGNPMGGRNPAAVSNFTVAVHTGRPGEESLFEEHRYPVPMAVAEWFRRARCSCRR